MMKARRKGRAFLLASSSPKLSQDRGIKLPYCGDKYNSATITQRNFNKQADRHKTERQASHT